MSKVNRVLLVILIVLAIITAIAWFAPELLSSITNFLPWSSEQAADNNNINMNTDSRIAGDVSNRSLSQQISEKANNDIPEVVELTPFEKDVKQRHESYETKVFTYEPFEPPVSRNPFSRIVSTVYLDVEKEKIADELLSEDDIRRFVQPELPPGSRFTGLIAAGEDKLAILEIEKETYIVKQGDLILDKYFVKSIQEEKIIIDINDYDITLQLGGGGVSNE